MLQAERLRVPFLMMSLISLNLDNPSASTVALVFADTLTESIIRKRFWGVNRGRNVRLRHMWADCIDNVGASTSYKPTGLYGVSQGELYFYFMKLTVTKMADVLTAMVTKTCPFGSEDGVDVFLRNVG
jgi:hypothetical protein